MEKLGKSYCIRFIKKSYFDQNKKIPEFYECSICLDVMVDPVTTISGNSYEREVIKEYLEIGDKYKDPISSVDLSRD